MLLLFLGVVFLEAVDRAGVALVGDLNLVSGVNVSVFKKIKKTVALTDSFSFLFK